MKHIIGFIAWLTCLCLRASIATLSWTHERVKHGPPARLWLARDSELLAEVQKRGLMKKARAGDAEAVIDPEVDLAAKTISKLNCVPFAEALKMAHKAADAVRRIGGKLTAQGIVATALKPVA